jgi:hypothetical protein
LRRLGIEQFNSGANEHLRIDFGVVRRLVKVEGSIEFDKVGRG